MSAAARPLATGPPCGPVDFRSLQHIAGRSMSSADNLALLTPAAFFAGLLSFLSPCTLLSDHFVQPA